MTDLLATILALIVSLGLLISVHEFGHFWVARRLGVKVLRFSIGFGRPLWSRQGADGTEYVVAALPLGGYVKMLDEREGKVPEQELHRAFNRQSVGKRFAIVSAGPIFNFLFAILAYWLMFVYGAPGIKPILGELDPEGIAYQSGLRQGQEIVAVEGKPTPTWGSALDGIIAGAVLRETIELKVRERAEERVYRLELSRLPEGVEPAQLNKHLGLAVTLPPVEPRPDRIIEGGAAERAGLRAGDLIQAIDGKPVDDWAVVVELVQNSPGKPLRFDVRRDGQDLSLTIIPAPEKGERGVIGKIGAAASADPQVLEQYRAELQYGPFAAVPAALTETWDKASLTLRALWEMVAGRVAVENLSGPIAIAVFAKSSAVAGVAAFLSFLGLISVSLGILNFLPIPILDGGHLAFYLVEAVRGRPVSEQTEAVAQRIGLAVILTLMFLAFYNDITRLAG